MYVRALSKNRLIISYYLIWVKKRELWHRRFTIQ